MLMKSPRSSTEVVRQTRLIRRLKLVAFATALTKGRRGKYPERKKVVDREIRCGGDGSVVGRWAREAV